MKNNSKKGRPKNSEVFALSSKQLKEIRLLAQDSLYSPRQVFDDTVNNGLATVRAMYSSIINYRKNLEKLREQKPTQSVDTEELSESQDDPGEDEPTGEIDPEFDPSLDVGSVHESGVVQRLDFDSVGGGEGTNGEGSRVFDSSPGTE